MTDGTQNHFGAWGLDLASLGVLEEPDFVDEATREQMRSALVGRPGSLAVIGLREMPDLVSGLVAGSATALVRQLVAVSRSHQHPLERLGLDRQGRLLILLPEMADLEVDRRLSRLGAQVAGTRFTVGEHGVRGTPVIGWTRFSDAADGRQLLEHALSAAEAAAGHLDLLPVRWVPEMSPGSARGSRDRTAGKHRAPGWSSAVRARIHEQLERAVLPSQIGLTFVIGIVVPFVLYELLGRAGIDVSGWAYWAVLASLLLTAVTVWVEGFLALDPDRPPADSSDRYPDASAIIAAYLPNEAATILDTVAAFQRLDYPGDLQIIVAYNTPHQLPVEAELREISRHDPRVLPLRIKGSTSKAQNVNAALSHITGEFVGMFDADHQPAPHSFRQAWRWLSNGYDVVQGHCVIRNGADSLVARTVAVEFEAIYAVSHPGRKALHGFGLFGGSNGYWRTDLLARIRMQGSMLTEDIDSTLRVLKAGGTIASDPALVSRELAPTTLSALWNQRTRWAQGWFQVSRRHLISSLRSPHLRGRQKAGMAFLLGWREIYPWLSLQMIPVLAYRAVSHGHNLNWLAPSLLLTTLFTFSVGPAQTLFAYLLAVPELRMHRRWFWTHLLVSCVIYTEWKNVIARVAQIKELVGEQKWNITPRSRPTTPHTVDSPATPPRNVVRAA